MLTVFAERGRDTLVAAETKLTELETEAVRTAPITPGAVKALEAFRDTGRTVTIVSNNSQAAVETFIADRGRGHLITGVCSRQHPEPELLKPNPFLVRRALAERSARAWDSLMLGDSASDVAAAHAAHTPVAKFNKRMLPAPLDIRPKHSTDFFTVCQSSSTRRLRRPTHGLSLRIAISDGFGRDYSFMSEAGPKSEDDASDLISRAALTSAIESGEVLDAKILGISTILATTLRRALRGMFTDDPFARRLKLRNCSIWGPLDLSDIKLELALEMSECEFSSVSFQRTTFDYLLFRNCQFESFFADDAVCHNDLWLIQCRARAHLSLVDAKIGGNLVLEGLWATGKDIAGIDLDRCSVGGDLDLQGAIVNAYDSIAVTAREAVVSGNVVLDDSHLWLHNDGGQGLNATGAKINGNLEARRLVVDSRRGTGLYLERLSVAGEFLLESASIRSTYFPTFFAPSISARAISMADTKFVNPDCKNWAVSVMHASIVEQLDISGATIIAPDGGCLSVINSKMTAFYVVQRCRLVAGDRSSICAVHTAVDRQVTIRNCDITSKEATAVECDRIRVQGSLFIEVGDEGRIENASEEPTVDLGGAVVEGRLVLGLSRVLNTGDGLELYLLDTEVKGSLDLAGEEENDFRSRALSVSMDGFTYGKEPYGFRARRWTKLLRENSRYYSAQPYQHAATVARASGDERAAREILVAQQHDLLKRGDYGNIFSRLIHRASGLLIGYGYRPWRALGWLCLNFGIAMCFSFVAARSGLFLLSGRQACDPASVISSAVKLAFPVIRISGGPACTFVSQVNALPFRMASWWFQVVGWSLSTLFIAGFTGLIRKN